VFAEKSHQFLDMRMDSDLAETGILNKNEDLLAE